MKEGWEKGHDRFEKFGGCPEFDYFTYLIASILLAVKELTVIIYF